MIVDTGPIVTLFDPDSKLHGWAREQFGQLQEPLLTCESVVSEAAFLMRRDNFDPKSLVSLLQRKVIVCGFDLMAEIDAIHALFHRFADQSISLADASLVRMSELYPDSAVFTMDRDFLVYRRNGRQKIPLIAPFA